MAPDPNGAGGGQDPLTGPLSPVAGRDPARRRGRSRLLAPLATTVAVGVVVAGTWMVVSRNGETAAKAPPVLHLSGGQGAASATGGPDAAATAVRARLVVAGPLPSGPDHARVHTLGSGQAPEDLVADLAHTLGLSGHPKRTGDAWSVSGRGFILTVNDGPGWAWRYSRLVEMTRITVSPLPPRRVPPVAVPPAPVPRPAPPVRVPTMSCLIIVDGHRMCPPDVPLQRRGGSLGPGPVIPEQPDGTGSGSAGGSAGAPPAPANPGGSVGGAAPTTPPTTPPSPPSEARIRAAARPILAALGLEHAAVEVTTGPDRGVVVADPVVSGLPTTGLSTVLQFDGAGRLASGSGWLAVPRAGTRYPLDTARAVLSRVPEFRCPRTCPQTASPVTVTGAQLGLVLARERQAGPILVPAWFYDVRGRGAPLVLVAVARAYLDRPLFSVTVPDRADARPHATAGAVPVVPHPPAAGVRPPLPGQSAPASRPTG